MCSYVFVIFIKFSFLRYMVFVVHKEQGIACNGLHAYTFLLQLLFTAVLFIFHSALSQFFKRALYFNWITLYSACKNFIMAENTYDKI